jgi:probable rRNA maturation factor
MILIEADASGEWDSSTDWPALAERGAKAAVAASDFAWIGTGEADFEVSVRFSSDEDVRALNAAWRARDKATNVLSFPMIERDLLVTFRGSGAGEALLGDVILAHGVCAREAAEKGVSTETHAAHLIVHGMLHLLGYDHETGNEDAEAMEETERRALAGMGISDPYHVTEAQT